MLQTETSFWLTKDNSYGNSRKEEVQQIFYDLEMLCEYKNRADSPLLRQSSKVKLGLVPENKQRSKLKEDFILHDIEPI